MSENPVDYQGYFKNHVKAGFDLESVKKEAQFVESQLRLVSHLIGLSDLGAQSVLEVGSGLGRLYYLLTRDYGLKKYQGIEIDEQAAQFTNSAFGPHFLCQSLRELSASQAVFDQAWAFEVFEHLEDPVASLSQLFGLLKPGGLLVASSPYPYKMNILSDKTHLFVLHPQNWKRLLEKAGFEVLCLRPMTFLPYLWRIHPRLNAVLPFYFGGVDWLSFNLVSTTLMIAKKPA